MELVGISDDGEAPTVGRNVTQERPQGNALAVDCGCIQSAPTRLLCRWTNFVSRLSGGEVQRKQRVTCPIEAIDPILREW